MDVCQVQRLNDELEDARRRIKEAALEHERKIRAQARQLAKKQSSAQLADRLQVALDTHQMATEPGMHYCPPNTRRESKVFYNDFRAAKESLHKSLDPCQYPMRFSL